MAEPGLSIRSDCQTSQSPPVEDRHPRCLHLVCSYRLTDEGRSTSMKSCMFTERPRNRRQPSRNNNKRQTCASGTVTGWCTNTDTANPTANRLDPPTSSWAHPRTASGGRMGGNGVNTLQQGNRAPVSVTSLSPAEVSHGCTDHSPLLEVLGLIELLETRRQPSS